MTEYLKKGICWSLPLNIVGCEACFLVCEVLAMFKYLDKGEDNLHDASCEYKIRRRRLHMIKLQFTRIKVRRGRVWCRICPRCGGTGTFNSGETCYYCHGTGSVDD